MGKEAVESKEPLCVPAGLIRISKFCRELAFLQQPIALAASRFVEGIPLCNKPLEKGRHVAFDNASI